MPAAETDGHGPQESIEEAFKRWDERATQSKARCQRWDLVQTIFPPLAALLLSIQVISFPSPGPISRALIAIELAVLFVALIMALLRTDLAGVCWVPFRLKAEVLRREQYLLKARVGAYLHCADDADLAAAVQARLAILDNEAGEPREFIPLTNPANEPWRHQLENARVAGLDGEDVDDGYIAKLPQLCESYYQNRLLEQETWYQGRAREHRSSDNLWESLGRVALAAALVFAAIHLTAMYSGDAEDALGWLVIVAIALPPISAACSEVQALLQGRQLSLSYSQYERDLAHLEARFAQLLTELRCDGALEEPGQELAFRFKRLVLEAEELFASEMRTWSVLMAPNE
jgi:hypothetical protein